MIEKKLSHHRLSAAFAVCLVLLASCGGEKIDLSTDDTSDVQNETIADALFAESGDLTSVTISSDNATAGGRMDIGPKIINVNDPRLSCAKVTLQIAINSTLIVPKGMITIDFGSGCTDNNGNVRKGIIQLQYNGRRFLPSSSVITTLIGYEFNGIKIGGTRTVTNTSASTQSNPSFSTVMSDGAITWPDGTTLNREENTSMELIPGASLAETKWTLTGSSTGKNRNGVAYSVTISTKLVYKASCAVANGITIPVSGTKDLIVNSKKISVSYGDGTCDRLVTVTIKSKSKQIELTGNN